MFVHYLGLLALVFFFGCCVSGDERSSGRGIALLMRVKMLNIPAGPPRAPALADTNPTNPPRIVFYVAANARLLFAGTSPSIRQGWTVSRRAHLACVTPPPHPAASAVRRWCSRGSHSLLQLGASDPDRGCCQASPVPQAVCLSVFCLSLCLPVCVFECV